MQINVRAHHEVVDRLARLVEGGEIVQRLLSAHRASQRRQPLVVCLQCGQQSLQKSHGRLSHVGVVHDLL